MTTKVPAVMLTGVNFIPILTSVNAIKDDSLNPSDYPIVRLRTNLRDQEFEWMVGDYTTRVATDIYNGRYIKKNSVAANVGCWVAVPKVVSGVNPGQSGRFASDTWHTQEFDVPVSTWVPNQDASPYLTAMINLENIDRPGYVQFSNGLFELFAKLPKRTYQCNITGKRNGGFQDTGLRKRYIDFTSVDGIFSFSDVGVTMKDLAFQATDSVSGGSAISLINDTADYGPGDTFFDGIYVSCGLQVNQSLYVDGSLNVKPSPPDGGYRVLMGNNCQFFGAAVSSVHFVSVKHAFFTNTFAVTSGGDPASFALRAIGAVDNVCDDFVISGLVSGKADFLHADRGLIISEQHGDVTGVSSSTVTWCGRLGSGSTSGVGVIRPV